MKLIRIKDPKGRKTVSVGLSVFVEGIINEQIIWRNINFADSPYLFPGKGGNQRRDCSSVERFKVAAGLPITFRPFHGLRHHFAVTLANSGKFTLDIIAEMLTHKDALPLRRKNMANSCLKP